MERADLETTKRGRGRPLGSTRYKDLDSRIIVRAGDAILADTDLTTRTAIARAVKRETGKNDANALRRVQMKMNRTAAMTAALERRKARTEQDKQLACFLLTALDFIAGGPTFQRFVVQPEVQGAICMMVTLCEVADRFVGHADAHLSPITQAAAPIIAELQKAKTRPIIDIPRLR